MTAVTRVLMIAPTPYFSDRGCHVRIYEEAKALQAMGCEVEVCTYHLGNDRPGLVTHRTSQIPWYNKLSAGPSWHKMYIDLLLMAKTWAVTRRFRPDVIHGHLHEGAAIGWAVGRLLGIPVVGDFQGSLSGELHAHEFVKGSGWLYRTVLRNESRIDHLPDVAIASCSDVADDLESRFGVQDVVLALDAVDTEVFRPDAEVGELASLVPPGRRAVVYLGMLNAYQGVDHLLRAIPGVLSRVPEAYFLIMGYPNEGQYGEMARELGVAEHVYFPGRIDYDEAARYLALGEVAVAPKLSPTESNGKLFNYMACALPTVAFDTAPSREILGELGVYAPRGDVEALSDAIAGLLEDPESARELGAQLYQRATENFTWTNTANQLLSAYAMAAAPETKEPAASQDSDSGSDTPDQQRKKRDRILNIVKIAVSLLGILAIVLTQDLSSAVEVLLQMAWVPFLGALLLFLSGVPVRAYRWGSLLWSLGVQISWGRLVSLWFVGSFFNLFLPTGLGGDAVKMYEVSRDDGQTAAAISSVVVDRFLGLFVLLALACLALVGGYQLVTLQVRLFVGIIFFLSLFGVALVLQRTWLEGWGRRFGLDRLLGRVKILRELYESIHHYTPQALLRATAASLVFNLTLILGNYLLGIAVGLDLSLWYYFLFVPVISVLLMVPSVGGLGIREGAYVFLFSQVAPTDYAVALALAYDLTLVISGLIGAIVYFVMGLREART